MRTIKYRAWDTVVKVMDYEGGQLEPTWILHNKIYEPYSDAHILMQFTGLLDKNGKEVYELDWIQTSNGSKFVMVWDEKQAAFKACGNDLIYKGAWLHPVD